MSKKVYITYRLGPGLLANDPLKNKCRLINITDDRFGQNFLLCNEYARLLGLDIRRLSSVPKHMIKPDMFIYD